MKNLRIILPIFMGIFLTIGAHETPNSEFLENLKIKKACFCSPGYGCRFRDYAAVIANNDAKKRVEAMTEEERVQFSQKSLSDELIESFKECNQSDTCIDFARKHDNFFEEILMQEIIKSGNL